MPRLFVCLLLSSCASVPLAPNVHADVRAAIERVRVAYPELDGMQLELKGFHEDAVFFASIFDEIHVNPDAFALGIRGLDGVIAHELAHTLDYVTRGALAQGAHLVTDETSFERMTDLIAIDRGYGEQLLEYRVWQFGVLTKQQVAQKKRIYYGPLEMTLLLDVKARCPDAFRALIDDPPRSARDIVKASTGPRCLRAIR